jgi:hypothetical protein
MKRFRHVKSARAFRPSVRIVLAAGMTAFGFHAFAAPLSGTAVMQRENVSALRSSGQALPSGRLLHQVALVNPPDRECVRHYEKRVRMSPQEFFRKYGATGQVDCPLEHRRDSESLSTGNFTCAENVITMPLHVFVAKDGSIRARPQRCTITLVDRNGKRTAPIPLSSRMIAEKDIFKISKQERKELMEDPNTDWAVVQTRRKAESITPYQVFDRNPLVASHLAIRELISLSAPQERSCPTISVGCKIHTTNNPHDTTARPRGVFTDCDTMEGASGGADLQEIGGRMTIVSIHTGDYFPGMDTGGKRRWFREEVRNDFSEANGTHSIVVERDFLKALVKMCGAEKIAHLPADYPYDETTYSEPPTIGHK